MSVFHPSEDEELERLKAWWKAHGNAVIFGILLGAALVVGVNYWRQYQARQAETASALYEQMVDGQAQKETVHAAGAKLMQEFIRTPYAGQAALFLAGLNYAAGDIASARAQLQWAIDKAQEDAVRHVARLRLARIMLDQGELEPALNLINVKDQNGFKSDYEELRGDLLARLGRGEEARSAYRLAKEHLPQGSSYGRILDMKLDDLGGGA